MVVMPIGVEGDYDFGISRKGGLVLSHGANGLYSMVFIPWGWCRQIKGPNTHFN